NQFYLAESSNAYLSTAISVRIGLCMLSLAPLILCIISQNRQALYKQVLYLANHDSLTRAMTRRYFFQQSELLLQHAKQQPFSIIMLDIDHFKKLNDQHGHYAGDLVLQHFARTVQHNLRNQDLFARIGGEEFVIFLKDVIPEEAFNIAERIRKITEHSPVSIYGKEPLNITVSIGITHHNMTEQNTTLQNLINFADFALYKAKEQGRNQVASYN
ncbi:MAG: GGDEF domain-containing protein, partial [Acinetobacter sp.]